MPMRTRRQAAQAAQTFRFLDLPLEIRLIIYNFLPITTKHHELVDPTPPEALYEGFPVLANSAYTFKPPPITLVEKNVPVALRATCRQINRESFDAFRRKLKYISQEPVRLMVHAHSLKHVVGCATSLIVHIDLHRARLRATLCIDQDPPASLLGFSGPRNPIHVWPRLPLNPKSTEYRKITEFVHKCAATIEARLPPYRSLAILVRSIVEFGSADEIETAQKHCRSKIWSPGTRDCLNIEYYIPKHRHKRMKEKRLFVSIPYNPWFPNDFPSPWSEGVPYV